MRKVIDRPSRAALERLSEAVDRLEGYPRQGTYRDGTTPPPGVGITERAGRIVTDPETGSPAYQVLPEVLERHAGKTETVQGQPVTIPAAGEMRELPEPEMDDSVV